MDSALRNYTLSFLITLCFTFAGQAKAADQAKGITKSKDWIELQNPRLKNLLKSALSENQDVENNYRQLQSAIKYEGVARNGFFPQLTLSASNTSYSNTSTSTTSNAQASATISENLFSGFSDSAKIEAAKIQVKIAELNWIRSKVKCITDLISAISNQYYAQTYTELAADILHRRQTNAKLVELRFESGRENKGSLLLARAYLEQAKLEVLQANDLVRVARAGLEKILGSSDLARAASQHWLQTELPSSLTILPEELNSFNIATQSTDVKISNLNVNLAETQININSASLWPTLTGSVTSAHYGTPWFPQDVDQWSAGITLSYSFALSGKDLYNRQVALESKRANLASYNYTLKDTQQKIEQVTNDFIESQQKLNVDKAFEEAASLRSKIAREKYNNGLISFDDWDLIENDLITRQKNKLTSQKQELLNEASWLLQTDTGDWL